VGYPNRFLSPQSPSDPLAGTPYRTLGPLGRGAMGEVVEAEHIALAKRVVVKILHRWLRHRPDLVDRMRLEGQALAHLSHPNIVAVTDLQITPNDRPYLVMERLYGRTLRDELNARRVLPVDEAVSIVRHALAGLVAAHDAGIIHRDLKPENIFLCDAKTKTWPRVVKLLDFGIAKLIESRREGAPTPLGFGTDEGVALGTPQFFAPEQVAFSPVDERTDVYAMGVVLYALVAGRGPFEHLTELFDVLEAHMWTPPERPSILSPQPIRPELEEVILKALAKRPEDRFPSARPFAEALTEAMRPRPRWESTEPLRPRSAAELSPFAPRPPQPKTSRWPTTEPLPPRRPINAAGVPSPLSDPTKPQ
jgi:eukaryotic-like serine/threonine-protein kinase